MPPEWLEAAKKWNDPPFWRAEDYVWPFPDDKDHVFATLQWLLPADASPLLAARRDVLFEPALPLPELWKAEVSDLVALGIDAVHARLRESGFNSLVQDLRNGEKYGDARVELAVLATLRRCGAWVEHEPKTVDSGGEGGPDFRMVMPGGSPVLIEVTRLSTSKEERQQTQLVIYLTMGMHPERGVVENPLLVHRVQFLEEFWDLPIDRRKELLTDEDVQVQLRQDVLEADRRLIANSSINEIQVRPYLKAIRGNGSGTSPWSAEWAAERIVRKLEEKHEQYQRAGLGSGYVWAEMDDAVVGCRVIQDRIQQWLQCAENRYIEGVILVHPAWATGLAFAPLALHVVVRAGHDAVGSRMPSVHDLERAHNYITNAQNDYCGRE